jgi:DndB-like DNA-sulfur modification-associated protein
MREGLEVNGTLYKMEPQDSAKLPLLIHLIAPHPDTTWTCEHLQQVFHDVNVLAESVRPALAIRGEHYDVFIGLARELGESCDAIAQYGGMTVGSSNPKGHALVSQQQLLKFVRAALGGPRAAESDSFRISDEEGVRSRRSEIQEELCHFLSTVAEAMGEDQWKDRGNSFHLTSAGWATMGLAFWFTGRLKDELKGQPGPDALDIAELLAGINWQRDNEEWVAHKIAKRNPDGEVVIAGAGRSTRAAMFKVVVGAMLRRCRTSPTRSRPSRRGWSRPRSSPRA